VKLKFALLSDGQDSRDLVATIDASTTVGDLATYLVNADPFRPSPEGAVDFWLSCHNCGSGAVCYRQAWCGGCGGCGTDGS
jgi:hypothetical protein